MFPCTIVTSQAHFARRNNLADVSAKESSQETAVTLLGLVCGMALASLTQVTRLQAWIAFLGLTALHVVANWRAVASLTLVTLNQNRAWVAADAYIADAAVGNVDVRQDIGPDAVARAEQLWPGAQWHRWGGAVLLRSSLLQALCRLPLVTSHVGVDLKVRALE